MCFAKRHIAPAARVAPAKAHAGGLKAGATGETSIGLVAGPLSCKNAANTMPVPALASRLIALPQVLWRLNSSGSFATFTAIRRASSLVSNFAAVRRPGSLSDEAAQRLTVCVTRLATFFI